MSIRYFGPETNRSMHYCKKCNADFRIKMHEKETGFFILECPRCGAYHPREFRAGVAVSCNIGPNAILVKSS